MRSGQIQQVIANGVAPFQLCRLVSTKIRTDHKRGGHIQDSIDAVFHSLSRQTAQPSLASLRRAGKPVNTAANQEAGNAVLAA